MGEEDYLFLPPIQELLKHQMNATLEVVACCGHVVNVEQPVVFNATTLGFLKNRTN